MLEGGKEFPCVGEKEIQYSLMWICVHVTESVRIVERLFAWEMESAPKVCLDLLSTNGCDHSHVFISPPSLFHLLWSPPYFSPSHLLIPLNETLPLCCLSPRLCPDTLFYFPPSPPHPPNLSPAGCKMDSPQSDSSRQEPKAEENRAQGELQRGRRPSNLLWLLSTLLHFYFLELLEISLSILETSMFLFIWVFALIKLLWVCLIVWQHNYPQFCLCAVPARADYPVCVYVASSSHIFNLLRACIHHMSSTVYVCVLWALYV